jgi:hypothetical protein
MGGMRVLPLLFALAPAAPAFAEVTGDRTFFATLEAGILCVDGTSTSEPAPGTRLGYIDTVEGDISLGLATTRIPALPDLSFGVISTVIDGQGATGVTIIVSHPPMGTEGSTRDAWQRDFYGGGQDASFFSFDYPEELVTGDWTMQAMLGDRLLYEASFVVVDPGAMPGFASPCQMPPQIS